MQRHIWLGNGVAFEHAKTLNIIDSVQTVLRSAGHSHGTFFFFFQAEDGIRDLTVTGVQTCALPILVRVQRRDLSAADGEALQPAFVDQGTGGPGAPRILENRAGARLVERRPGLAPRSEESRVGEKGRSRGTPYHLKKKKNMNVMSYI